ncbi:FUSC family protein [Streptomyces sp. SPB074]|uniref:FUSC family protein n=1 Tax=Streptomyces sp. (strain SPB074) TaxID=465543 RepID=UPI001F39EFEC|nr:FUSC family protein [Streptomyces sp. SPB074]
MARGLLGALPLVLAVAAGRPGLGVMAALGSLLAAVNDRPGSRRTAGLRLGAPALAGTCGLLLGSAATTLLPHPAQPLLLPLVLTVLGLFAGAVSAVGPVASGIGTQVLVTTAIGAGMPLPEPGWQRALAFLTGAAWLLALRLLLPSPDDGARHPYRLGTERASVASVYTAIAALLDATGTPAAPARRSALTTALDQAQDALLGPRLHRFTNSAAERRLHARLDAALPLAEAATALYWAGRPLPARTVRGPLALAEAVRADTVPGPVPAPARDAPGLRALDTSLLSALAVFASAPAPGPAVRAPRGARARLRAARRRATGPAGREYGIRVALSMGAATAVAQSLHPQHWYWLPATAVFLVKPDLGPLASRVLCRIAGTLAGAGLFAGLAAVAAPVPLPPETGLVALAALCATLVPLAMRHFALQTAVVTLLVLALVGLGGDTQATWNRLTDTLLACGIVLLAGHLPLPGRAGTVARGRLATASQAATDYLGHVLSGSPDLPGRWALRRAAYRSLAQARAAVEVSAAELPPLARRSAGAAEVTAVLERLVDTTTAAAVHADDAGTLPARDTARLRALLGELDTLDRHRTPVPH